MRQGKHHLTWSQQAQTCVLDVAPRNSSSWTRNVLCAAAEASSNIKRKSRNLNNLSSTVKRDVESHKVENPVRARVRSRFDFPTAEDLILLGSTTQSKSRGAWLFFKLIPTASKSHSQNARSCLGINLKTLSLNPNLLTLNL